MTNESSSVTVTVAAFLLESRLCLHLCQQHIVNSIDLGVPRIVISHKKTQTPGTMVTLQLAIGSL